MLSDAVDGELRTGGGSVYPKECPAKRKRATLKSDVPRDSRMGWRRLSVRGSQKASPPTTQSIQNNLSYPPMP